MDSLRLLRDIRDIMAQSGDAQKKLDLVVESIASGIESSVCSVYLLRAGDVLELFANVGFKRSSIHTVKLGIGQGLIGLVASTQVPLNLKDAKSHPEFVYVAATGEEEYNSFLGVPLIRSGELVGVLAIQDKTSREYGDMMVEILQIISMVVAELVFSSGLINQEELEKGRGSSLFPQHIMGSRLADGIAKGFAHVHEPAIEITKYVADDPAKEQVRFEDALRSLRESIDSLVASHGMSGGEELAEIMEVYRLFAYDKGWAQRIRDGIASGLTAEAAVRMAQEQMRAKMEKTANEYLRERMHDIENIGNRLLQILSGNIRISQPVFQNRDFVLVARHMGPAELFEYDRKYLKGIVLESGSPTSHIVIIARALDIPVVGRLRGLINQLKSGEPLIINGNAGEVYLNPTNEIERVFDTYISEAKIRKSLFAKVKDMPAVTLDGQLVRINMNAGLFIDLSHLHEVGADGIGLYRTELPFMMAKTFPDAAAQGEVYSEAYRQCGDKPIIFRTFDIGGDKNVDYIYSPPEENPAMGWRAARIAIDRPSIFRTQARGLIIAAADKQLKVMFPFIATAEEVKVLKRIFMEELEVVNRMGYTLPRQILYGAMIEIPAVLFDLDGLFRQVDFVSVGSNDLMQFLFACDRNSQVLADRYSMLCPAMFEVLSSIPAKAAQYGREVGFCGEMASRPAQAMCLLAMGFHSLSMPASAIGAIKAMIRSLDLNKFTEFFQDISKRYEKDFDGIILNYARDNNVII